MLDRIGCEIWETPIILSPSFLCTSGKSDTDFRWHATPTSLAKKEKAEKSNSASVLNTGCSSVLYSTSRTFFTFFQRNTFKVMYFAAMAGLEVKDVSAVNRHDFIANQS